MKTPSRPMSVALLVAFVFSMMFAGSALATENCDPAACAAKCQAICKDSSLTQAERLEKCKEICKANGGKECTPECRAKCEAACKATCPHGAKAEAAGDGALIKTASATASECPHAKAMTQTAEATDAKAEAKTTSVKDGCAATCGAAAAKACAAKKEACAMTSKAKEKPE